MKINCIKGVLIQGDSHRNFESNLQKRVAVGSVYKLSGYSLRTPRANFRTSKFPHWLELTAAAQFELQPPTDPPFPLTAFDFIPFSRLNSRMPPCPYLTDLVGKVVAVGEPNHVERNSVVAPVQKVTIIDASGLEVVVSLWSEFSAILDAASIVLDDKTNPFIVALGSFRIGTFGGDTTAGSCPASRIAVRPDHPAVNALRNVFTITPRPIAYIPPKFHTPEKLKQHVQDSFRTLQELEAMYVAGSDPEPRYRCVATIIGCDRHQHWCYRACPQCSCSLAANGASYWCSKHDTISAEDVVYRYRLKLYVSDPTTQSTFILLGLTADRIMPISATELARAYPDEHDDLPPPIKFLLKQTVTFEVQLPRHTHTNTYNDFKISKILGLKVNRSQLISQLPPPPPPPPRSPSPTPTHNTPLPPDPAYVPPVYIYQSSPQNAQVESEAPVIQQSNHSGSATLSSSPVKPFAISPSTAASPPPVASPTISSYVVLKTIKKEAAAPHEISLPRSSEKRKIEPVKSSTKGPAKKNRAPAASSVGLSACPPTPAIQPARNHSNVVPTPPDINDDEPLVSLIRKKNSHLDRSRVGPLNSTPPSILTPSQQASQLLKASPLAKVKQERLQVNPSPLKSVHVPLGTPSVSSPVNAQDKLDTQLKTRARKRLFDC
ncbi:Replication protein A 70 kDa DNA-binding subunit E [Linum perenne]